MTPYDEVGNVDIDNFYKQKPQEDESAAAIKKDNEDFIAKSTHDVQITNDDEK